MKTKDILISPASILALLCAAVLVASVVSIALGSFLGVMTGPPAALFGLMAADRIGR